MPISFVELNLGVPLPTPEMSDKRIALDDRLEASLSQSIEKVLQVFFGCSVSFGIPLKGQRMELKADISGVVNLFQSGYQGVLNLGFPKEFMFKLLPTIYKQEFTQIDQKVIDGVGEITNSVYGLVKKDMNLRGYQLRMTIPTVVVGHSHSIVPYTTGERFVLPVVTEFGDFHVSVNLDKSL